MWPRPNELVGPALPPQGRRGDAVRSLDHACAAMSRCISHQVVRRSGKGEDPLDSLAALVMQLSEQGDRFHPAQALFDLFSFPLTDRVSRMSRGSGIDRTPTANSGRPLSHVGCRAELPQVCHAGPRVVRLVKTDGDPVVARPLADQIHRSLALGGAGRRGHHGVHNQRRPILHQHMPGIPEPRFRPAVFLYNRASGSVVD